jgi:hypothetical protein
MEGDLTVGKKLEKMESSAVRTQAGACRSLGAAQGKGLAGRGSRRDATEAEQGTAPPPPSACTLELAVTACAGEAWSPQQVAGNWRRDQAARQAEGVPAARGDH